MNGVTRAWLCWNVQPDWCLVQQKLAYAMGWTPVVGGDPRIAPPYLIPEAIYIDFNAQFNLPVMYMHFPLEFAWLWCDRLAFWHSDLLVHPDKLRAYAAMFDRMHDGEMAATKPRERLWTRLMERKRLRYWELLGCTTRDASRMQFEFGAGWWANFHLHPSVPPSTSRKRAAYYWDHGVGIRYWQRHTGIRVHEIPEEAIEEGHCSRIRNPRYLRMSPDNEQRDVTKELVLNYDLQDVCFKLGLLDYLD